MKHRWYDGNRIPASSPPGGGDGRNWQEVDARIRGEFLDRSVVIDCPDSACHGVFVTDQREVQPSPGTGARIVLRCTRRPEDHDHAIQMPPYTTEEREKLRSIIHGGETPHCTRCGTPLILEQVAPPGARGTRVEGAAMYKCPWCGVRFVPPGEVRDRVP